MSFYVHTTVLPENHRRPPQSRDNNGRPAEGGFKLRGPLPNSFSSAQQPQQKEDHCRRGIKDEDRIDNEMHVGRRTCRLYSANYGTHSKRRNGDSIRKLLRCLALAGGSGQSEKWPKIMEFPQSNTEQCSDQGYEDNTKDRRPNQLTTINL